MYEDAPYHVIGRSEDHTYALGRRTVDGWENHVDEAPEADLEFSTFVEHHKDGKYVGLIEASELARINAGRANGTIIGHGEPTDGTFVVAGSDSVGATR